MVIYWMGYDQIYITIPSYNSNFELWGSILTSIGLWNEFIGEFNIYRTNTQ